MIHSSWVAITARIFAERKGFEPLEHKAFNGFRDRPDRPLSHISAAKVQHFSIGQEKSRKKTFFRRKPVSLQH